MYGSKENTKKANYVFCFQKSLQPDLIQLT